MQDIIANTMNKNNNNNVLLQRTNLSYLISNSNKFRSTNKRLYKLKWYCGKEWQSFMGATVQVNHVAWWQPCHTLISNQLSLTYETEEKINE